MKNLFDMIFEDVAEERQQEADTTPAWGTATEEEKNDTLVLGFKDSFKIFNALIDICQDKLELPEDEAITLGSMFHNELLLRGAFKLDEDDHIAELTKTLFGGLK